MEVIFRQGQCSGFQPTPLEEALGRSGGQSLSSAQLKGSLECLWLQGIKDQAQVSRMPPEAE